MAGPIRISILADARPAVQGMHQVEQSATGMGSKLGKVGSGMKAAFVGMGTALAAAGIVEGFKHVIDQAASLSAAVGTTKSIFGKSAQGMLDWSKTASMSLGLSQAEALNATKVFGGFFVGVGMGSQAAADMSKNWTTMAANMAAFGDIPVAESLDAVKSALIGEYDPIQKLIPTISAASLQQKAMELSGKKNAKALTDQDKAAALNAIMMDSMANKVGAAERKQAGYAVQMDRLKAQLNDAAAAVGGVFLPALTKGMDYINTTAIPAAKKFGEYIGPKLKGLMDNVSGFKPPKSVVDVAQSKEAASIFTNLQSGLASLAPLFNSVKTTIMPIVTSIGDTLGTAFNTALPQIKAIMGTIGEIVTVAFETVKAQISNVVTVIQFIWQNFGTNILAFISTAFSGVVTVVQGVFNVIKGIFNVVLGLLTGDWQRAWDGVKSIITGAWQIIKGVFTIIKANVVLLGSVIGKALSTAWNGVKSVATTAWNAIKALLLAAWNGIKTAISTAVAAIGALITAAWNAIKTGTSAAWNFIKSVTSTVWNAIKAAIGAVWGGIKSVITTAVSTVKTTISNAWNTVKTATATAWTAVKTAVTTGIGNVVTTVKGLPGKVKGAISGAATWLTQAGKDLISGMIKGITDMAGSLADKARSVVSGAVSAAKGALGISSPSKVFMEIGENIVKGLAIGIETNADDITKVTENLASKITKAFPAAITKTFPKGTKLSVIEKWKKTEIAAGKKRVATKNALLARVKKDNDKLLGLVAERDKVADSLKDANARLEDLQQSRANMVTSVAGAFENTFRLINDTGEESIATIDDVLARSRESVDQSKQFAERIKTLATKGVAPEILQELAMAGPKAGLDTARALSEASAEQLQELNENYKLIAASGAAAGETVAANMYDTGIAAAQSIADGFASQQAYLEASILQIIDDLNRKITAAIALVTPKTPAVVVKQPVQPVKKAAPVKKGAKPPAKKAVPAVTTKTTPVTVTVNTGVVVDKRGMVDAISSAFNEVSGALGRPISMNVR